ncbi:MAG: dihydropyrimidine dehydrogenase subunit [Solirubrobacterales bacterium]|nr:dihydropyrimidine dehydrogenase subunit [Solirubrobacterales bacterium]
MADRLIVVGAGLAGLAAALELAAHAEVELVERLPAAGGSWQFDHPAVRDLVGRCDRAGVRLTMGVTALRWIERRLLLIGPGTRAWREADHLVFAGGTRPATPAELPLFGARVAGVFAGTVAHHLMEAHIALGRHLAVCGSGYWADLVLAEAPSHARVTVVGGDVPASPRVAAAWPGYAPVEVRGRDRVEQLVIERDGHARAIDCDCVVLAADQRPIRNVDGAITATPDVTYVQLCADTLTPDAVVDHAIATVAGLHGRNST